VASGPWPRNRRWLAAAAAALLVLADSLQVNGIAHLCREARHVQLQPLRIGLQMGGIQSGLLLEQKVVHGPKSPLPACTFRCQSGIERVRMNFLERKVAIHETQAIREMRQQ
jgi:hypothetical protein